MESTNQPQVACEPLFGTVHGPRPRTAHGGQSLPSTSGTPIGSVICWQTASLKCPPGEWISGFSLVPGLSQLALLLLQQPSHRLANHDFVYRVPRRPNAYLADISNCVTSMFQTLYLIHLFIFTRSFSLFSLLPGCSVRALPVVKPSEK